jgi:hypothetical protein
MVSLYDAAIPGYLRMLNNVAAFLDKAEAHAKSTGVDPQTYLDVRVAEDMHPLLRQIQMISDGAKGGAARLAGVEPPSMPDTEATWAEAKARIAKTVAFVASIKPEQVSEDEGRIITLKFPNGAMNFTASDFVFQFALPNFQFHVVTAYGLLRKAGVPLGKMDYLAGATLQPA